MLDTDASNFYAVKRRKSVSSIRVAGCELYSEVGIGNLFLFWPCFMQFETDFIDLSVAVKVEFVQIQMLMAVNYYMAQYHFGREVRAQLGSTQVQSQGSIMSQNLGLKQELKLSETTQCLVYYSNDRVNI